MLNFLVFMRRVRINGREKEYRKLIEINVNI